MRCSLTTDFDRKELSYQGIVLAATEAPTIRIIEADFLVRGKNIAQLAKKLEEIAQWLFEAGTSELFTDQAANVYYKARCTAITTPEYTGLSAKFTATFRCDDYRLYDVSTDSPREAAGNYLSNFKFAGKHCLNDMGCVFVRDSVDAIPASRVNKYKIAGRSGTLRYSKESPDYDEKTLSGVLYFVKSTAANGLMTGSEIMEQMHKISSWLAGAERAALILDGDTSRQYEAEVVSSAALTTKDWENGCIKLKFVVQPISQTIQSETLTTTLALTADTEATVDLSSIIPNGIGCETPLLLTIKNTGSVDITDLYIGYYSNANVQQTARLNGAEFALKNGETLELNSDSMSIVKANENGLKWLKSGNLPVLTVGGNKSVTLKSSVAASIVLTVSCNARWL